MAWAALHDVTLREEYRERVVAGVGPRKHASVHDLLALFVNLQNVVQFLPHARVLRPQVFQSMPRVVPNPRRPRLPVPRTVPARPLVRRRAQRVHPHDVIQVVRVPTPQLCARRRRRDGSLKRGSRSRASSCAPAAAASRAAAAGRQLEVQVRPVRLGERVRVALLLGGRERALQRLPRRGLRLGFGDGCRIDRRALGGPRRLPSLARGQGLV
mmetsp:Transcript_1238/g.5077  ORF Transcript_1238/g.5077 Transcript_1238/m.5077 type:complete len:213 (+) Transcript_1238:1121-1759(+)